MLFLAAVFAAATLFFAGYGVVLVHYAVTFKGEGSLGHVGMYIAAFLFPLLAFFFGALTLLVWRKTRRKPPPLPPPNNL